MIYIGIRNVSNLTVNSFKQYISFDKVERKRKAVFLVKKMITADVDQRPVLTKTTSVVCS